MKKVITILLITILSTALTGCGKITTYHELTYQQLQDKLAHKDSFALVIGSSTCSACKAYKMSMESIIEKYQIKIYYIDISKLDDTQNSELKSTFAFMGTPATIFITKGKEKDTQNRIKGNEEYNKIIKKLKHNGYIKEA